MNLRIWRRPGVRSRSALAAGLVVAAASVLAAGLLILGVREILLRNVTTTAEDRAAQVTAALATNPDAAVIGPTVSDRSVVQILDASGAVLAASPNLAGNPPLTDARPASGTTQRITLGDEDETFLLIAYGVSTPGGERTVVVAASLDPVADSTEAIAAALALTLPLLVLLVGAATFHFVGRTLRPVEAMRRRADTITGTNLHARLPVADTGDEIAALATTMNTMLDRIETATAAQRRFVADASHELRSPLATVHANADLLGDEPPVRRIRQESARMVRLVEDLLMLARADDRQLAPRRIEVDLDDLVFAERDRITMARPDLTVDGGVTPVRVLGDPDQLLRVVRNLADNAARHAAARVTIGLERRAGRGVITVGNDGPPIPAADRERIFDRFVRLDDSRSRDQGGSGLGLAIAREIAAAHGGGLRAANVSTGALMVFDLPAPD